MICNRYLEFTHSVHTVSSPVKLFQTSLNQDRELPIYIGENFFLNTDAIYGIFLKCIP